jgi:putative ABC transport system permease protein
VTKTVTNPAAREGGAIGSGRNIVTIRRNLVSVELGVTLVLLTCAALLGETFLAAASRDTGMIQRGLATAALDIHAIGSSDRDRRLLTMNLLDRLSRLSDVIGATGRGDADEPASDGMTVENARDMIPAGIAPASAFVVSPEYFHVVGVRIIGGREFTALDGPDAPPVAILSDSTARRLFANGDAIGRRVKFGPPSSVSPWMTVVGIAREVNPSRTAASSPRYHPVIYRPLTQISTSSLRVFVRTRGPSAAVLADLRAVIRNSMPGAPLVGSITTFDAVLDRQLAPLRINAVVLGAFAFIAVVVAMLGIYGIVAYLVELSTGEIGVRMALGARRSDVVLLQVGAVMRIAAIGIAGGLVGSYLLTGVIRSLIYDTSPTDVRAFGGSALLLAAVTLLAAYLPARRAATIDPAIALRLN